MSKKWYLQTWFIGICFACWFIYGIPLLIGVILIFMQNQSFKKQQEEKDTIQANLNNSFTEISGLQQQIQKLNTKLSDLGADEYFEVQQKLSILNSEVQSDNEIIVRLQNEIAALKDKAEKLDKQCISQEKKLTRIREIYKSVEYSIDNFFNSQISFTNCKITSQESSDLDLLAPTIMLKLHCMDMKSLRSAYRENEKQINKLLEQYSTRYTTKSNKAIYSLITIALMAELQNILYNLKFEKLEKSIDDIKTVSSKYLTIAGDGNQSIAGTLTKFIGEMEYLFINAVKIEYNYYVKKEQARQEQLAIKEQMRQEAEERKALEAERKKIEKEEAKFESQISVLTKQAETAEGSELDALKNRILELQAQLADVVIKKDEISNLQNGKAGNVYIISNLGSFGDNVFKIGMTRRLDPQDRINELGDASVPFKFDVHSFIFSDDASDLETELHKRLHERRVNKVNLRKEFFNITIDELEELVTEICPTAEFNKTMLAEEFRQSQSSDEIYSSDFELDDMPEEE